MQKKSKVYTQLDLYLCNVSFSHQREIKKQKKNSHKQSQNHCLNELNEWKKSHNIVARNREVA